MNALATPASSPTPATLASTPGLRLRRTHLQDADTLAAVAPVAPIWEPVGASAGQPPTTSAVLHATRPPEALPAAVEAAFVATLTRPLAPGETHTTGNAERERELASLIVGLTPLQAHHLGRRLDIDRADDALARAWKRLLAERRERLRALLRDPRRATLAAR